MTETAPTFRALVTSFADFLTVAIHTILYERSIYPRTSFLSARKYNFPVRQSRHPKVCEWINDAVAAVAVELLNCAVSRVAMVIYDKNDKPLERYVFDVTGFPEVAASDLDVTLERTTANDEDREILPIVDMEEQFRATMAKLASCNSSLRTIPQGCTFTIAIELKEDGGAPVSHPQPWMPVQPGTATTPTKNARATTKPVRSVNAGEMVFEAWIEQLDNER